MLRVTFFAIPNQMEIKRTEVHYFVRKPRLENNEFSRSIAASSGHSKAELDIRSGTLVSTARSSHLPVRVSADSVLDRYSEIHVGGGGRYSSFHHAQSVRVLDVLVPQRAGDRKSTRLNSSHSQISYAVFCLKKKQGTQDRPRRTRPTPLQAARLRS